MQRTHLAWPFFDAAHRSLADDLGAWAASTLHHVDDATRDANDLRCRQLVGTLGGAGWTRYAVPVFTLFVFSDVSYVAYFNSFYTDTAAFLFMRWCVVIALLVALAAALAA